MGKIFRYIGFGLLAVVAIISVFVVTLVLYNLEDEALNPEVVRLLEETPQQIPAEENAYFAWIGVLGPQDESPHEWGRRWFEEAVAVDRESGKVTLAIESEIHAESSLIQPTPCNKVQNCLDEVASKPDGARKLLVQGKALLRRCDSVMDYPGYQEPWRPQFSFRSAMPRYQFTCVKLQETRFALAVANNHDEEAIRHIEKEMAFHVRQARGSVSLIDKVVAMANLQRDYLLLNQYLLKRPEAAARQSERFAKLLAPLDLNVSSMENIFKAEFLFFARGALDLSSLISAFEGSDEEAWIVPGGAIGNMLAEWFYLPNETINQYYEWYSQIINAERLSGIDYRNALEDIRDNSQEATEVGGLFGLTLRNPVGNMWILVGHPGEMMMSYFQMRDDLLAIRGAVAFQLNLLSKGVSNDGSIEAELAAAGLVHRFTGDSAIWHKSTRSLIYPAAPELQVESQAIRL